ncbi:hypothetical protein H0H92_006750, partial [Tricholoma furcatifolium]
MAVSKRKAQTVASSSEDELEGDTDSPPPNKHHSKPTAKRGENDKENLDKEQAAFICAKKKLEQLQKVSKRDAQKRKQLTTESDAELPESEDEDPPPGFFSSAILFLLDILIDKKLNPEPFAMPCHLNKLDSPSALGNGFQASLAVIQTSPMVRPSGSSSAPPDNCSSAVVAVKLVAGLKLTDSPAISDFADAFSDWLLVKARESRVCGIFVDAAQNTVKEQFGFVNGKGAQKFMKNMGI